MRLHILLAGALLAAPLFSHETHAPTKGDPMIVKGQPVWFTLNETRADVLRRLGDPVSIADFGNDYQAWHYHLGNEDRHDFSHYLVFRRSTDKLISITRVYEHGTSVDQLFAPSHTSTYFLNQGFGARVRKLTGGRLLIAMGSTAPGKPTQQIMLIAQSELKHFHEWLHHQMAPPAASSN